MEVVRRAQQLEKDYRKLTGRPLGVTGEVGEVLAVHLLDLSPAEVRNPGYDAFEMKDGGNPCRYQIKTRVLSPSRARTLRSGRKPAGRAGSIDRHKPWDAILMVLLDENIEVIAIYQADRPSIEAALDKSESRARKRGALPISEIISEATVRWKRPSSLGLNGPLNER
ncbi:MAG: hypothetical protein JRN35_07400 [Nitrososphaerota archaeon]|nr:hypothetical protein [Nitrososphaerota archaeon]